MKQDRRFGDVDVAASLRDVIRRLVRSEVNAIHPPDTFGEVQTVDTDNSLVNVLPVGGTTTTRVPYSGGAPGVGDTVRITGRAGSRYLAGGGAGVIGGGSGQILVATVDLPDPDEDATVQSGTASWAHLSGNPALTDLTDPTNPVFATGGMFSIGFGATLPQPEDETTAFIGILSTTATFSQPDLPKLGGFSIVISGFTDITTADISEIEAIFGASALQTLVYAFNLGDSFSDTYIAQLKSSETATGGATLSMKCIIAHLGGLA